MTTTKMTPQGRAAIERRRSNAAGPHDRRPNRARSRADARRVAIRHSWETKV